MCWVYGKIVMTFIIGFKQQKHLEKRNCKTINFENDVNCGIIAFCDKRSFLTGNGLSLQRNMEMEVRDLRHKMRTELDIEQIRQKVELMVLKVSSTTPSSNLHLFTPIHRGVDICCPILHHYTVCLAF
jgi:hypothetical protein